MSAIVFSLEVQNLDLTRALRRLSKYERMATHAYLRHEDGSLNISLGQTSVNFPASGSWPGTVEVNATWAKALAATPYPAAIILLKIVDGKLHARDFVVPCEIITPEEPVPAKFRARRKAQKG